MTELVYESKSIEVAITMKIKLRDSFDKTYNKNAKLIIPNSKKKFHIIPPSIAKV